MADAVRTLGGPCRWLLALVRSDALACVMAPLVRVDMLLLRADDDREASLIPMPKLNCNSGCDWGCAPFSPPLRLECSCVVMDVVRFRLLPTIMLSKSSSKYSRLF